MCVVTKAEQLCRKLQESWEQSQRLFFRDLSLSAPSETTRRNCRNIISYMVAGLHNYGRHYHVDVQEDIVRIRYSCEVSGMVMIHCVINKNTGDVAKYSTELINESCFQFNILDPRSAVDLFSVANHTGDYLS